MNMNMVVTVDIAELQFEIDRLLKMPKPKCHLRFRFLWDGLKCKIKRVHFWQRYDLKLRIK